MKITFKHCRITAAIMISLSLSSCARFDTRMQANGSFEYQQTELTTPYKTGNYSNHEARNNFDIPELTAEQKKVGFQGVDVDVRPPTQLIPVLDGVLLEPTKNGATKVWFNAFSQNDDMQEKVWQLIDTFLHNKNVAIVKRDENHLQTGTLIDKYTFGSALNKNTILKESSYNLTVEQQQDGYSVGLLVDVLSYSEKNEDKDLKLKLVGSTKQDIELRFVNDLLNFAYNLKESEQLAANDNQPLSIKLGFDDNHQSAWIVDNEFLDTWRKLPALFKLLSFSIVEQDKNLGYFLLDFKQPDSDYWAENNLQPFELDNAEYFVQLGELTGGTTSITWLDEDKKPLPDQKVTEIYLSITEQVRGVLIENNKQTKEF
ncbi:outer membrane assembly protein BamC [Psychromonas sp. psych-6C06]|uniref:outer membrane protein assembly factor BamC n=1 Tax=Psychromonas sp. psych-6C06 TaxID=2058089 RepID=UPI000C3203A8|nr:outer membrane protein assembly factor BamC [Psychromonas sp. psych-6C06]PKF61017.1 outer membrane assembly protein BamC [Psychromonas sp. psych-6C06]